MKFVALVLVAVFALPACADGAGPDNREQAEVNAVDVAPAGNGALPSGEGGADVAAGDRSNESATNLRDVPIKGGQSKPAGPPPADEADQCGASRHQWLVGRPRSAIPPQPEGARWRVTCTGCPITMDYNPARLNIFYDSETERVEEVRCG